MQLSKRENYLIEILMKNNMTLTAQQLAEMMKVSTKTIYRMVKRINEESREGEVIVAEIAKGFRLDYEKYLSLNTENKLPIKEKDSLVRRNKIVLILLFKSPNSARVKDLFKDYFVSEAVIFKDIKKIESFLSSYHLKLKRDKGRLAVAGYEKNIRKAANSLIEGQNLADEAFSTDFQKVSSYDIDFLTSLLEYTETKLGTTIAYPYNVNIFSHLYILMKRNREGFIESQENRQLEEDEKVLIDHYHGLYQVAEQVITRMGNYLNISLDEIEIFYLFNYLISSRLENFENKSQVNDQQASAITDFFMDQVAQAEGDSIKTAEYHEDLLSHITPLLYRLRNEIFIRNNLLKDIKLEYPEMFQLVAQVAKTAEGRFHLAEISEDEIGFLVLYFVKYKEMKKSQKKVIIMCSSGVGTSELLRVKVQKAFPEVEIVDVLSSRKFMKDMTNYSDIDLILTTIHLKNDLGIPSLLVNAVFTKQDEERTKNMLQGGR